MEPLSPTATNCPPPAVTARSVCEKLADGVRAVQFIPFGEDRMVPFAPTATNKPLVNVTPNRLFAVGFGAGVSQMAKGSVALVMTVEAAITARMGKTWARLGKGELNIVA